MNTRLIATAVAAITLLSVAGSAVMAAPGRHKMMHKHHRKHMMMHNMKMRGHMMHHKMAMKGHMMKGHMTHRHM